MVRRHKLHDTLRVAGWNVLLLLAGVSLMGLAGELWLRSTVPFRTNFQPTTFVPNVGVLLRPDTEVRWTNQLDFWTVSRTNSLGFLDREPPSPERAAESCHIAVIGDSFVEARQVPIAEKFHIQLEDMAARELPRLDVSTSAFGMSDTGQIAQLALYEYARPLSPKLVVLVFVPNDYIDNFPLWRALRSGLDPEHLPYAFAARTEDGGFALRPPSADYQRFKLPTPPQAARPAWQQRVGQALGTSWLWTFLHAKYAVLAFSGEPDSHAYAARVDTLATRYPAYAPLLDGRLPVSLGSTYRRSANEDTPSFFALFAEGSESPFYREALAFTAFAWSEFKRRVERDGAQLVMLASHRVHRFPLRGEGIFVQMSKMAAELGIPVIDQAEVIYRQGAELGDAGWANNDHWSPRGHRWAAQALLEYLKLNQELCE